MVADRYASFTEVSEVMSIDDVHRLWDVVEILHAADAVPRPER